MSEAVSALNNAAWDDGTMSVRDAGPQGMITLRGDLSSPAVAKAVTSVTGAKVPSQRCIDTGKTGAVAWMSPDELLLLCPYADVAQAVGNAQAALDGAHALVTDVSDARAIFEVSGPYARDVLAKLAPVDLAKGRFEPGEMRRTRLAQVAAALWMPTEDTVRVICFRSVAVYAFDVLTFAAKSGPVLSK